MKNASQLRAPAPRPCASCPYRCDAPSAIWAADEYVKLPAYDRPTAEQPPQPFKCHQTTAEDTASRLCGGWVGCHGDDLLALRLAAMTGRLAGGDLAATMTWESPVELFASGAEAAAHGMRDMIAPSAAAQAAGMKIRARRADIDTPTNGAQMTESTIPAFTLDGLDEAWPAVWYGDRWNGWATPVVTRSTLEAVLSTVASSKGDGDTKVRWEWEGAAAVIIYSEQHDGNPADEDMIPPTFDDEDLYDLGLLGWRFIETDFWSRHEDLAQLSEITERATGLRAIDLSPVHAVG